MRLRSHHRDLAVWNQSAGSADVYAARPLTLLARRGPIRRWIHAGALLAVIGPMRLIQAMRPRWRAIVAGGGLTVVGVILRGGPGGVVLLPGLLLLLSAPLIPASLDADRKQRFELERELAVYSTPAQRRDLEAILDRYPDAVTHELRDILASREMATCDNGIPGAGRC